MDDHELRERVRRLELRVAQLEANAAHAAPPAHPAPPPPSAGTAASPPRRADVPGDGALARDPAAGPFAAPPGATVASPFAPPPGAAVEPPPLPGERRAGARVDGGDRGADPEAAGAAAPATDFERLVGLTLLGRVGIAAMLLAAAYFGQLGWTRLGPGARAACVYAFGGVLIALGAWLRPRVAAKFTALLWGGGVAMTYLGGALAHLRYAVLSAPLALASLLASAALGQFLARRLGLEALATITLGGAYAAPVLVGTPSPTPTAFFTVLLVLHAWAAWTEHRWRWHTARALAVVATVVLACGWYSSHGVHDVRSFALHTSALWLGLAMPELIAAVRGRRVGSARAVLAGLALTAALVCVQVASAWRGEATGAPLVLALAALLGGGVLAPRAAELGSWIARAGSLLLAAAWFAWSLQRHGGARLQEPGLALGGLAAVGALLLGTRRWTRVGDGGTVFACVFAWVALGLAAPVDHGAFRGLTFLALALHLLAVAGCRAPAARAFALVAGAGLAVLWLPTGGFPRFPGPDAGWNALALVAASAVATFGLFVGARARDATLAAVAGVVQGLVALLWLWWATQQRGIDGPPATPLWNVRTGAIAGVAALALLGRALLPAGERAPRALLAATAVAGVYCGGLLEVLDAVAAWSFGPRALASSFYTLAFASALLVAGFRRRLPALRWTALLAFVAMVVKIGVHDLRELDTPARVLAAGVLGGVLLVAAWAYAKRSRGGAAGDGEPAGGVDREQPPRG